MLKSVWDSVPILEIWPQLIFPFHPLPVIGLDQSFFHQQFNDQDSWVYELYSDISQDKLGYAAETNNPKILVAQHDKDLFFTHAKSAADQGL